MENKKGMFTGFRKVFGFTASQNVKGKGFKLSTILIALVIAAIFAAISIFQAVFQDKDNGEDNIDNIINTEEKFDIDIYYVNETGINDLLIQGITEAEAFKACSLLPVEKSEFEKAKSDVNGYLEGKKDAVVMILNEDENTVSVKYYIPYDTEVSEDTVEIIGEAFNSYYEYISVNQITDLDDMHMFLYNAEVYSASLKAGDEPDSFGLMLTKMLVPMLFSLVLYMMILLYGQNITKIVVSEKSSKLMETLLTSVKPYAIIAGKIVAVSGIAIMQMLIWLVSGVAGFYLGEKAAHAINPNYINYVSLIIDMIKESSDAFSIGAVLIALLMVIIGFFMYSVLAGLVAALVERMEDISSVMGLFQVPVVIGFLGAYFVSMSENDTLKLIVKYFPITSPFYVPSGIMTGDIDMASGIISLLIVAVVTLVLIVFTGKIYKGKLFNRH